MSYPVRHLRVQRTSPRLLEAAVKEAGEAMERVFPVAAELVASKRWCFGVPFDPYCGDFELIQSQSRKTR